MNLALQEYVDIYRERYHSNSQLIRVVTETWMKERMYCPVCGEDHLTGLPNNSPVADFRCDQCEEQYQLKSKKNNLGKSVTDGEYHKMREAVETGKLPNFFFLNYLPDYSSIINLVMVPKEFILPEVIVKRKPLSETARRAGWQGCNIRLDQISDSGKVFAVKDHQSLPKDEVVKKVKAVEFFRRTRNIEQRGWLNDILLVLSRIKTMEFRLSEVYHQIPFLQERHPDNHNIEAKIRQQLQVLRKNGLLEFLDRGVYRKL